MTKPNYITLTGYPKDFMYGERYHPVQIALHEEAVIWYVDAGNAAWEYDTLAQFIGRIEANHGVKIDGFIISDYTTSAWNAIRIKKYCTKHKLKLYIADFMKMRRDYEWVERTGKRVYKFDDYLYKV